MESSFALLAALSLLGSCSTQKPDRKSILTDGATKLLKFYDSGDTTGLREIFTASMLTEIDMPGLLQQRNDFGASLGALSDSKGPEFLSDSEASMRLYFENKDLEMVLGYDPNGHISSISLSNLAPDSLIPRVTWVDLGNDTLRIHRSLSFAEFRDAFVRDSDRVRVVALLSPT